MSSSSRKRRNANESSGSKERRVTSIVGPADYAELERHHRFVLEHHDESDDDDKDDNNRNKKRAPTSWQERMVQHYHEHLYKDYVLADLTRVAEGKLGLRWRTEQEVRTKKGSESCGNKHCPSHNAAPEETLAPRGNHLIQSQQEIDAYLNNTSLPDTERQEVEYLQKLSHGAIQTEFEVPFSYVEDDQQKMELVKLRLCARCAPLLFRSRGEATPSLAARQAREGAANKAQEETLSHPDNNKCTSDGDSSGSSHKRGKKRKKKDRHRKDGHGRSKRNRSRTH